MDNTLQEKTKDLMDHRDDSTFSFDPEKLTHARPLEKKKPKNRRVIVMRRGAGILSDKFSKKKKKKDGEETDDKRKGSASSEDTSRQPSAPPATPRLTSSQATMSAGQHSMSRPASLVVTPPPSASPGPPQSPGDRCQGSQGASLPRTGASSSCDPCNASSATSCCTCHCHTRQQQVAAAPPGLVALRGGCDDPRPHLRLANNPAHRQPSLDDSGVVGDHDGGDTMSIHHLPHAPQVGLRAHWFERRVLFGLRTRFDLRAWFGLRTCGSVYAPGLVYTHISFTTEPPASVSSHNVYH